MIAISLITLLCQSESPEELETTARELGCTECKWLYNALHLRLPDGCKGSFRTTTAGYRWCGAEDAE